MVELGMQKPSKTWHVLGHTAGCDALVTGPVHCREPKTGAARTVESQEIWRMR